MKKLTLLTAIFLFIPFQAKAQETAPSTNSYVPPPMFGASRPLPPKKATPDVPTMPKLSLPADPTNTDTNEKELIVKPKTIPPAPKEKSAPVKAPVIPLKKPPHPKVAFDGKAIDAAPEKAEEKTNKKKIKSGLEPIDLIKKNSPTPSSEGVVKGPKTMPSNKKESVETEVLFESDDPSTPDLIDRPQPAKEKAAEKPKTDNTATIALNPDYTLPNFKVMPDGSRKLHLIFKTTQAELDPEQVNTINALIIPALEKGEDTRALLEAFASPQEGSLSGDRRLALTRAMAIRKHITTAGNISPSKLDVRSLGSQTDAQPMDRVEILLVN